jgi:hypothetical protein
MAEADMIAAMQAAVRDRGIDDTIVEVGQFEPRGTIGATFAGGLLGSELGGSLGNVGEAIGLGAGVTAGRHAEAAAQGLPREIVVGASATTVYGFAMARGGRKAEPDDLLFQIARNRLQITVHNRVNVHVLELVDAETGHKIELEGNRLPITHSSDLIKYLEGPADPA